MRTSLLLVLALVGCSENSLVSGGKDITDPDAGNAPDIEVSPGAIDFGEVAVGSPSVSETVTVTNVGDASLQISNVGLEETAGMPYTISAVGSVLLAPGDATTFAVTFAPDTAADWTTNVLISSNDPDEAVVPVALTATGIAPAIQVDPENFDFGTLYIGCVAAAPISLTNIGNADLVISGFNYVTASVTEMTVAVDETVNGPLPWTLPPGATTDVSVLYEPLDSYDDEGYLTISSNDPLRPEAQAHQTASGDLYGENLDLFEQPIKGLTDIIFTVDWSCSMADDIARVTDNFDVFVATLATLDADYQVSAVITDDGCTLGDDIVLDATMSPGDQQTVFDTLLGSSMNAGSYTEMGFTILEAATTDANRGSGGCNEDIIRDDATLAMVGVTDEVEQSANPWSYYTALFQSYKRDPDDLIVHAIAGDYPAGCGGNEPGRGWYEASVATGGLFLSICAEDWASHLEALAEGSASDLSSFELTQWPVPATVTVQIDGVPSTTGWTYNSTDNSVDFDEDHVPLGGSTIEVQYALFGDCDG